MLSAGVAALNLPPDIEMHLLVVGAQEVGDFKGAYEGSKKQPDVFFKFISDDHHVCYIAVVEVGLAEIYQELDEDVRLWIEGMTISVLQFSSKLRKTLGTYPRPASWTTMRFWRSDFLIVEILISLWSFPRTRTTPSVCFG